MVGFNRLRVCLTRGSGFGKGTEIYGIMRTVPGENCHGFCHGSSTKGQPLP